jgi:hypothetical protein
MKASKRSLLGQGHAQGHLGSGQGGPGRVPGQARQALVTLEASAGTEELAREKATLAHRTF